MVNMEMEAAPVVFTPGARTELLRLMNDPDFDTSKLLRVGVKGGGCAGAAYVLGFDDRHEDDIMYELDGLRFIMNKAHGLYLAGLQIDWIDGPDARGFSFTHSHSGQS